MCGVGTRIPHGEGGRRRGRQRTRGVVRATVGLLGFHAGGTTDHWATHVPKVHRGSHYSNGKGVTQVLPPPEYDAALAAAIDAAF